MNGFRKLQVQWSTVLGSLLTRENSFLLIEHILSIVSSILPIAKISRKYSLDALGPTIPPPLVHTAIHTPIAEIVINAIKNISTLISTSFFARCQTDLQDSDIQVIGLHTIASYFNTTSYKTNS